MRGGCPKWCAVFTCVVALSACSSPSPEKPKETAAPAPVSRQPIPEAPSTPVLSVSDAATLTLTATGDLTAIATRGTIRILVAPSPTDYVAIAGQQHGAAVDAGKAFETFARASAAVGNPSVRVAFIPLPSEQLLAALTAGHGDLIAGRFAHTYEREDIASFSEPIATGVREVLVTGPGVAPIVSLEDVAGRAIHVRRSSDHFASLTRLNGQLAKINKPGCTIVQVDPALADEDLLRMVNDGQVPVTLVDHNLAATWRSVFDKIAVNTDVAVSQDGYYAWVVRKDSPRLLALVNEFIKTHDFRELDARAVARRR
jgi:membrane-bound lytic murein transglycosylase MltF